MRKKLRIKHETYRQKEKSFHIQGDETVHKEEECRLSRLKGAFKKALPGILVIAAGMLILRFFAGPCLVSGTSMMDTLHNGDFLISDRMGYSFREPGRFDIVEFCPGEDEGLQYIKRVIGLPGETVQIDGDGKIYIDEAILEEEYGKEPILDAGCASGEGITLGEDEVFCLGDNRNDSLDSRFLGPVKISQIYGHPYFRLFPLTRIGNV